MRDVLCMGNHMMQVYKMQMDTYIHTYTYIYIYMYTYPVSIQINRPIVYFLLLSK